MIKTLTLLLALVLTTAAQAQKIDSTLFVAFYNYTIQTQDDEGLDVSDSIRVVLLVSTRATYYTTLLAYNNDGRVLQEQQNAFTMHHQNVLTDVEKNEVTAIEPLYPHRYETHDPLVKIDWTLTDDTTTITLWQRMDGLVFRGHTLICRSMETARTAGTDCQGRGHRPHSLLRTLRDKE